MVKQSPLVSSWTGSGDLSITLDGTLERSVSNTYFPRSFIGCIQLVDDKEGRVSHHSGSLPCKVMRNHLCLNPGTPTMMPLKEASRKHKERVCDLKSIHCSINEHNGMEEARRNGQGGNDDDIYCPQKRFSVAFPTFAGGVKLPSLDPNLYCLCFLSPLFSSTLLTNTTPGYFAQSVGIVRSSPFQRSINLHLNLQLTSFQATESHFPRCFLRSRDALLPSPCLTSRRLKPLLPRRTI